ncbi:MAG: hypothetical protein ACRD2W_20880 [Acidimicrobiales bacterium]
MERSRVAGSRPLVAGWRARPVAIPEDVDDLTIIKASGRVRLPDHIAWSGPGADYDLDDRAQRAYVYEQVMREGTEDDVRHFIDVDELVALWPKLYLPPWVREAWARWIRERRGLELAC